MGKKLTLAENAETGVITIAAQAEATYSDVITTVLSQDTVLTGGHGLVQKLLLVEIGAVVNGMRAGQSFVKAATFGMAG